MKIKRTHILLFFSLFTLCLSPFSSPPARAQIGSASASTAPLTPVTYANFPRAETDRYFAVEFKKIGALGKFHHPRDIATVDQQSVIRYNRDVLLSSALFDLDAGPVTLTLPDPGQRFMSILVINEDHYTPVAEFRGGAYTLTRANVGTRYAVVALRIFVDPDSSTDLAAARALQDAVTVNQPGGPGAFAVPNWDQAGLTKIRNALIVLGATMDNTNGAFGKKGEVDPIKHLIGTAIGWGGNPESVAMYLTITPDKNDGKTPYLITVPADVPVDAFWSIAAYNAEGYFQKNPQNAYNLNSVTAKKNPDGTVTIHFGGPDTTVPNYLPITKGWNYAVRLYRPRAELLDGTWKFPDAQPMQ